MSKAWNVLHIELVNFKGALSQSNAFQTQGIAMNCSATTYKVVQGALRDCL